MRKALELNHPLWKWLSFLSDCMILTIIWFLFSLPIVTLGPATLALLHVAGKIVENKENGVIREFTTVFLKHLRKRLFISNGMFLMGIILFINLIFYHKSDFNISVFMVFVMMLLSVLFFGISMYVLPLLAYLTCNVMEILRISFYMSIAHLKWTLFLVTFNSSLLFVTLYVAPYISFFSIGFLACTNMKVILTLIKENDYSPLISID